MKQVIIRVSIIVCLYILFTAYLLVYSNRVEKINNVDKEKYSIISNSCN